MPASVATSGSQTASIGAEHTLYDSATAGTFQLVVDTSALSSTEQVELRVYVKVGSTSDTYRQAAIQVVAAGDVSPASISPPLLSPNGVKYTLKQLTGTGRAFPWAVWSI